MVDMFEENFANEFGFEPWQIVSLNSGTAALELAYDLCNIKGGPGYQPEVITPILTCTATNIPLIHRNAHIVFADVEMNNHLNIDPDDVEYKISEDTQAIVFVHFGGSSAGLKEIEDLADRNDIDLICDAAQALGSKLSTKARFNCISLQAIKSLTAGDGGVLICRDRKDAEKARKLRWFGYDRPLKQKLGDIDLDIAGFKLHMNDISAAIALGNLYDWKLIKYQREAINAVYAKYGAGKGYIEGIWCPQVVGIPYKPMKELLAKKGIEIGQYHYRNDKYTIFNRAENSCPNMTTIEDRYFMLPCHMGMTVEDAERIAKLIWPNSRPGISGKLYAIPIEDYGTMPVTDKEAREKVANMFNKK